MSDCCQPSGNYKKGFWSGIIYGLFPHTFCILFLVFSIVGATGAMAFTKKFLLIPHFFLLLVIVSFLFATLSAVIYLRKTGHLSWNKIKNKWKYLTVLYTMTLGINVLVIFVIFPAAINFSSPIAANAQVGQFKVATVDVNIPCSGHAPLVIDEVKKDNGVSAVRYTAPSTFEITFDPAKTSVAKIAALDIFKAFKLKLINF